MENMGMGNTGEIELALGDDKRFAQLVHGGSGDPVVPSGDKLFIATKDHGTVKGRAMVAISFSVLVEGKVVRAQYSTSVRMLTTVLAALRARYGDDGIVRPELENK